MFRAIDVDALIAVNTIIGNQIVDLITKYGVMFVLNMATKVNYVRRIIINRIMAKRIAPMLMTFLNLVIY